MKLSASSRMCYLIAGPLACAVVACSPSGPECSAENVIATVKKIGAEQLANNIGLAFIFDLSKTKYQVTAIRTIKKDDKSCDCKANFHVTLEPKESVNKLNEKQKADLGAIAQVNDTEVPIEYNARLTDDGKVYVEASGF